MWKRSNHVRRFRQGRRGGWPTPCAFVCVYNRIPSRPTFLRKARPRFSLLDVANTRHFSSSSCSMRRNNRREPLESEFLSCVRAIDATSVERPSFTFYCFPRTGEQPDCTDPGASRKWCFRTSIIVEANLLSRENFPSKNSSRTSARNQGEWTKTAKKESSICRARLRSRNASILVLGKSISVTLERPIV